MSDKIYIKLTHNQDKQQGDNRPIFVAPVNPKSPEGKTWRLNVKIGETWYNQAGFEDLDEQGNPTGIINVVLTPSNTGSAPAKPSGSFFQSSESCCLPFLWQCSLFICFLLPCL